MQQAPQVQKKNLKRKVSMVHEVLYRRRQKNVTIMYHLISK